MLMCRHLNEFIYFFQVLHNPIMIHHNCSITRHHKVNPIICRHDSCYLCHLTNMPGGRLNIKMSSYQYRDSHYKDETVSRLSHLYDGNLYTKKDVLYIETGPWKLLPLWQPEPGKVSTHDKWQGDTRQQRLGPCTQQTTKYDALQLYTYNQIWCITAVHSKQPNMVHYSCTQ